MLVEQKKSKIKNAGRSEEEGKLRVTARRVGKKTRHRAARPEQMALITRRTLARPLRECIFAFVYNEISARLKRLSCPANSPLKSRAEKNFLSLFSSSPPSRLDFFQVLVQH